MTTLLEKSGVSRLAGIAGFLGGLCILAGVFTTLYLYRTHGPGADYSPLNHFISELGWMKVSPYFPIFSAGLILGTLLSVPALWLSGGRLGKWGAGIAALSSLAGAGVGLVPMDHIAVHSVFAFTYFTGWMLASGLFAWKLLREKNGSRLARAAGLFCLLSAGICVDLLISSLFFITAFAPHCDLQLLLDMMHKMKRPPILPTAVLEWLILLTSCVWLMAVSLWLTWFESRRASQID